MKRKDMIETVALIIAFLAVTADVTAIALQIHTLHNAWFRIIYLPIFAYSVIQTAIADMQTQRIQMEQENIMRRARQEQQFLEDYAKFVSEVHK